jgi:hypothetical protein
VIDRKPGRAEGASRIRFSCADQSPSERATRKPLWRTDPANGDAVPDPAQLVTSTFTSDGYMRGAPAGEPGRMIANPPTDPRVTYNAIESANVVAILGSTSNSPSIQASPTRSASVPATHFAP